MLTDVDALADALRESREYTVSLVDHLADSQWEVPRWAIVNPLRWEVGHIGFFQEFFCVRWQPGDQRGERTASCLPGADALYDSRTVAHERRWDLPLQGRDAIHAYLEATLERTLEVVRSGDARARERCRLALLHEDMHGEAILMTLQSVGLPGPARAWSCRPATLPASGDIEYVGAEFMQGTPRDASRHVFDNEKWAHRAPVAPFAMANRPVTCGEFAAFVESGGYRREAFWEGEGARWRAASVPDAPRLWRREGSSWLRRWFGDWQPVPLEDTMVHVNRYEAEAYCRWAGRRLPTEAEWEFAATAGGVSDFPWGDVMPAAPDGLDHRLTSPHAGAGPYLREGSAHGLIGGVWEWTATPFGPYPGFEPDAYEEYSQPYFGTHGTLRGGSFVTRSRLAHGRWRNFYAPHRNDCFAGFRTCPVSR